MPVALPPSWERHELLADPFLAALPVDDPLHDPQRPPAAVDLAALADREWVVSRADTACQELVQRARPVTRAVFAVTRRGGDRHPVVRAVLEHLAAAASASSRA